MRTINAIPRDNLPPSGQTPLVLATFRREAAKFFGLLKIIKILVKFWAFSTFGTNPPCFAASGNKGGVVPRNSIDHPEETKLKTEYCKNAV